jgi:hypothetical protein
VTSQKKRHGCLTAWLVMMIIANSATALSYLLGSAFMKQTFPNAPNWGFPVLIILGLANLICAIALLRWKKWGFWGTCASTIVIFITNLYIGTGGAAILGLAGPALLYAVLQIGGENNGWSQLD